MEIAYHASLGNTRRAEELLKLYYPREYLCTNVLNNIRNLSLVEEGPRFSVHDFDIPKPIWNWLTKKVTKKTFYIYGRTESDKTEAMVAFMERYIGRTLVVNTIDDLRSLQNQEFKELLLNDFDDEFLTMH